MSIPLNFSKRKRGRLAKPNKKSHNERKRKMNRKRTITAVLSAVMLMSQMSGFDVFANYGSGGGSKGSGNVNYGGNPTEHTDAPATSTATVAPSTATATEVPTVVHKITYNLDGGTYENAPTEYTEGIELELKGEPKKDKYLFDGWRVEENGGGIRRELSGNKIGAYFKNDLTLYAKWVKAYTIKYDFGEAINATIPKGSITKYKEGKKGDEPIKLPVPDAPGYDFKEWKDSDGNVYTVIDAANPKDLILTAQWEKVSNVIHYELNGGKNPDNTVYAYTKDTKPFDLPTPEKEGYAFDGWYSNADFTGEMVTQIVTGTDTDTTVYAKWIPKYTITYHNVEGVTNLENAPKSFTEKSGEITLPTPEKEGYAFDGWYSNAEFTGEKVTKIIVGNTKNNVDVYAKWLAEYKITYNNAEGATGLENAPATYTENGGEIVLPKLTKADTKFLGWLRDTDNDGKGDTKIEKIEKGTTGDMALYADWETTCTITYVTNGGEMPQNYAATYKTGTGAELAAPTRTGYNFKGWYTDEKFNDPIEKITEDMRGDITVYATWQRRSSGGTLGGAKYYVKFDSCGGSDVSDQLLQSGATARKPENPTRKGYTFAGWYTDKNYTEKFDFDTKVKKTTYLYAKWTKIGEDDYTDSEFDKVLVLTIGSKQAKINGRVVTNDVAPVLRNDRTMMPIRFVAESLGAKVEWDPNFRIVTVNSGKKQVIIHIGSDIAYVNGAIYNLDSPAYIENDRTYVPVRFVSEAIDCEVDWKEEESKVYILKK